MKLDDPVINRSDATPIGEIINQRWSRRSVLRGALSSAALSITGCTLPRAMSQTHQREPAPEPGFLALSHGVDATHHVPAGYTADVLIRWGDAVLKDAPPFAPQRHTAAAQARQFGYNNDYLGYLPLSSGTTMSGHGLLFVNHEFTFGPLMFPDMKQDKTSPLLGASAPEHVDIEMTAHGVPSSKYDKTPTDGRWYRVAVGLGALAQAKQQCGYRDPQPDTRVCVRIPIRMELG